ncbi:MAG: hypothetical protein KDD94_08340, partial [Calditrichaeota bacterium]|nr:hypothetical protein [Calditrichota bacterium]
LFKSIEKNLKLISIHFNIWLFKFLIIYFSFEPIRIFLEQFFDGKTINKRLFESSDASALFEFVLEIINNHGNPLLPILFVILLITAFMLVLDSLIDCGFIAVYAQFDKKAFWGSLKENANRMILLKITLLIPYLLMVSVIGLIMALVFNPASYQFPLGNYNLGQTMILLVILCTVFLVFLRTIDHAKVSLIINKKSVADSLLSGFRKLFANPKSILPLNFLTALLLAAGIYIYSTINQAIEIDSSTKILLIAVIFQFVIFLKQLLRFSYTGAIIEHDFRTTEKTEEAVIQTG